MKIESVPLGRNNRPIAMLPEPTTRLYTALTLAACFLLASCAGPSRDISRIPAQTDAVSSKDGLFMQPIEWSRTKPGCKGQCPELSVDSLVFPGQKQLTELVDHALAVMTGVGEKTMPPYDTIEGFEEYFWQTAGSRDEVMLSARAKYRNRHLTVLELSSGQYYTGAAHGITATQFLNWDNDKNMVLGLQHILAVGAYQDFLQELASAHEAWVENAPEAQENPESWRRMWPFQPSDNFALTDQGVVVKYDSYEIAPYSSGQPELLIPYARLKRILRPEYLPAA